MFAFRTTARCLVWLVAFAVIRPALAVDSWLIVESDVIDTGTPAWIAFVTGDRFPIGDGIVDPARVEGLEVLHGQVKRSIEGLKAEDDAMSVRRAFDQTGYHVLGLTLKPRITTLDGDVFDQYLIEERANEALQLRRESNSRHEPVKERYTKFSKTIVEVGAADDANEGWLRPIGHRLELVPLTNPTLWQSGETVQIQVLLDGHPWPEVPVSAGHAGQTSREEVVRTRTNERGIASIRLSQSGHWYAKAHLIRPYDGLGDYAWESFWATYTFRVKGKVDVSGSMQMLRAIHGSIDPWAVAGFIMGERALIELGLPYGSSDFLAVQHSPKKLPYSAMIDGLQAATGATIGKMNLKLKEAPASDLHCEFFQLSTGKGLTYRLNDDILAKLMAVEGQDAESLAVRMMTMTGEELFDLPAHPESPVPAPGSDRELAPTAAMDNVRARETALRPLIRLVRARMRAPLPSRIEPSDTHYAKASPDADGGPGFVASAAMDAGESTGLPEGAVTKKRDIRRSRGLAESLWRADTGFERLAPDDGENKGLLSPPGVSPEVRVTAR
ncbi:MAG: DUF4198 domain-containing protein [Phycisphaerales bacterium]|nr:DUF4198 domain-containing protein [Phycisphaerales bacterium]MCB9863895.1 DUF4198 domain-containing protein [Phycisphaerales bacterium]